MKQGSRRRRLLRHFSSVPVQSRSVQLPVRRESHRIRPNASGASRLVDSRRRLGPLPDLLHGGNESSALTVAPDFDDPQGVTVSSSRVTPEHWGRRDCLSADDTRYRLAVATGFRIRGEEEFAGNVERWWRHPWLISSSLAALFGVIVGSDTSWARGAVFAGVMFVCNRF